MYFFLIPVPFVLVFTYLVQRTKASGDFALAAVCQPLTTFFLIVSALLSLLTPKARRTYTFWVTSGLLLSLAGDVFIIGPAYRLRLAIGLAFYLAAHVAYAVGFTVLSGFRRKDRSIGIAFAAVFIALIIGLRQGLKDITIPAVLYGAALTFMAFRAVSTIFGTCISRVQGLFIAAGGLLCFIADALLAVSLFGTSIPFDYGTYLYYGGLLLFALSPSLFMVGSETPAGTVP